MPDAPTNRVSEWEIRVDDLCGDPIVRLLREHLEHMLALTPRHGARTRRGAAAWAEDHLLVVMGRCRAARLRRPEGARSEDRRDRVDAHRGRAPRAGGGLAAAAAHPEEALRRGYERLCLETGSFEAFAPARTLYAGHGFTARGPFGTYREDPNTDFMEKVLAPAAAPEEESWTCS